MVRKETLDDSRLEQLKSDDPAERCAAIEVMMSEGIPEQLTETVCGMITDPDKGVRNAVDLALTFNGSKTIAENLVKYVSSSEISVRNLAGEILLKIGVESVDAMLGYLNSGDDDDKKFIIDLLGLIGDRKASPEILSQLKTAVNSNNILACVEALGNLGSEESLDLLLEVYEKDELFKPMVIEALGKIGSKAALDFITEKYKTEDELTRFSIIESMGLIGSEETFYFLISELQKMEGVLIWPVIGSISVLKEKYELEIPFDDRMKNAILYTLSEAEPKYKKVAAGLIESFNDEEIISAGLKIFGDDMELDGILEPKFYECGNIIFPMISDLINKNAPNTKNLLQLIYSTLQNTGDGIIKMLPPLQQRNMCDSLAKGLDNPDEEIRRLSMELLFSLDIEAALLFVDKMISDDNMWNKLKLLELLDNISHPKSDEALTKLATDSEEMISERAQFIISQRLSS